MSRYLVGSTYGRFCIKFPQSRMKGERHRLSSVLSLQFTVLSACHYTRQWQNMSLIHFFLLYFQPVTTRQWQNMSLIHFFLLYFQPVTILDGGSTSESPTLSPSSSPTPIHPRNLKVQSEDNDSVSSGTTKDSGYEVRYFID